MSDPKTLQLLVVEDNLEDEQLLREALIEIEETRQWISWHAAAIVQVDQLADALDCLRGQRFDAVLLNLSLPDSPALLDTFLEVSAWAGEAPVIVLADEPDENLANLLLRDGAGDILLKSELECAPLARSIRYAIERKRRASALQSSSLFDELTGTLTGPGFLVVAQRYAMLPVRAGVELSLAFLAIRDLPDKTAEDRESRDLLMLRAGEVLRAAFPTPSLIGRVEKCRFELMTVGLDRTRLQALLDRAAAEIELAGSAASRPAQVRFQLVDMRSHDLDQLVDNLNDPPSAENHQLQKTVML